MTTSEISDAPPKRRRKPWLLRRRTLRKILPWVVIIGLFVFWELAVRIFQIEPFVLPTPTAIFESALEMALVDPGQFLADLHDHGDRLRLCGRGRAACRHHDRVVDPGL